MVSSAAARMYHRLLGLIEANPLNTPGMKSPGNIDLYDRPQVQNPDGGTSTVYSMGVEKDGKQYLIPRVVGDKILSPDDAYAYFLRTGEHLGSFDTPQHSDQYAQRLHQRQAALYGL
jgi:hypothetical protein